MLGEIGWDTQLLKVLSISICELKMLKILDLSDHICTRFSTCMQITIFLPFCHLKKYSFNQKSGFLMVPYDLCIP